MSHPTKPLSQLVTLLNGRAFKPSDWGQIGLPIIRIQNLNGEKAFNYFDGEVDEKNRIRPGELLFSWSGSIGSSFGPYKWTGPEAVLNQHIFKVLPREESGINKDYLLHALRFVTAAVEAKSHGSAGLVHVTKGELERHPIPVPSVSVQLKITQTLDTWDEAIVLQTRQLRQLQRRLTKMREDLLLAKRRLAGFFKPWQEVEIGALLKEVKRRVVWNENEEYALISMRRRSGGAFLRERLFGHQILTKNLRTAHAGDFLISKRQIVHGASGLVPAELDGMKISDAYVALVARNPADFDVKFFDCLSKMPWFYHLCYVCSHGIHIEKMMFDSADFLSRIIKVPALAEQRAIAEVLNTAEAEIRLTERKLAALREQKRGLLQQLLTGEILLS